MKKNVLLFITLVAIAVGGTMYGFTYKSDCPLAGTKDCPEYQNCPKKGQPDCPYTNGRAGCCKKK